MMNLTPFLLNNLFQQQWGYITTDTTYVDIPLNITGNKLLYAWGIDCTNGVTTSGGNALNFNIKASNEKTIRLTSMVSMGYLSWAAIVI